jgi:alpha-1,3-rhamnosyltransferase
MNIEKSNEPIVSIIVVTYNSSKYVLETLESTKYQTYKNIELIVSDDCSTDDTVEICRNWVEKNKERFADTKIITAEKNTGIPGNFNRGLRASKGSWIKFIAGDDVLLDYCIVSSLNFATQNDCEFIFSDVIWFNDLNILIDQNNTEKLNRKKFIETDSRFQLRFYSRHPIFLNSPTWFFSKRIFENKYFDESFKILEDQPFVLSYLESGGLISYLNKETVRYRKHNNSVIYQKGPNFIHDFELCFNKYRKKNLNYTSIIDLLFIFKYKTTIFKIINSDVKIKRYCAAILSRLNPINILNIYPDFRLKHSCP